MCGICGWVGTSDPEAGATVRRVLGALGDRGPDDRNTWCGEAVALGHTRLSIIDVNGSRQPMVDRSRSLVVTYNGELYNYRRLRAALLTQGRTFESAGDTEVLLHLYAVHGDAMVEHLDGIFAFALYDVPRRRLLLARDSAGVKPLYYWHDAASGELVFASDLAAMMAHPRVPRKVSSRALAQYLQFGYAIHPDSWLEQVRQVRPGELVTWECGRLTTRQWFQWRYDPEPDLNRRIWATDALRGLVQETVRDQLVADVPLGTFLSGGLDSTTVTGFAQRAREGQDRIRSLTVRFWTKELDESARACAIAGDLGTAHSEVDAGALSFDRPFMERFIRALGEPFADNSSLAVYLLCAEARRHFKVALSGDGGDELFLGYGGLVKQRWARGFRVLPAPLRRAMAAATHGGRSDAVRRLHKYTQLSLADDAGLIIEWARRWPAETLGTLFAPGRLEELYSERTDPFREVRSAIGTGERGGFLERQIRFQLLIDLPCDCLFKVDRMSMAHGVEVRVPLLSTSMLQFGARLPLPLRYRGDRTKEPLRTIAERLSPTVALPSPKRGFAFPLESWLRGTLAARWREWELSATLARLGFDRGAVDRLVDAYDRQPGAPLSYAAEAGSHRLYDLMLIAVWADLFRVEA